MMIEEFFTKLNLPAFLQSYFEKDDWYTVIGKFKDILQAEIQTTQIKSDVKNLIYHGQIYIGENCMFGDNVVIDGPVYIGNNVEISTAAYIKAGTIILDDCVIGHAAEIKNSMMMQKAKVQNHTFLGDSIIGVSARLGGHSETANRRFDQQEISFSYQDRELKTGLTKLGAILGDGARLGGGVFTYPGTMIGKNTFIATKVDIGGYIPANKFVKIKNEYVIKDNTFDGELK